MIIAVVIMLLGGAALVLQEHASPRVGCLIWGGGWSIMCNVEEK